MLICVLNYDNKNMKKPLYPDHDTHWKELIEKLFWKTLAFFLPKIYAIADQSKGVEFLDKELHKLIADKFKGGNTRKDKLAKIYLKDGKEHYVLIHFEVQGKYEKDFLRRMFVYFYRIFDKKEKNITALVIYTGESVPDDCDTFVYEFMGTKVTYQFNAYRVCAADEAVLLADDNPMALAVLAAKYLNETKSTEDLRRQYKMKLIRLTLERSWSDDEIRTLLQFINLMVILSSKQEIKFVDNVKTEILDMKQDTIPPHVMKHNLFLADILMDTLPTTMEKIPAFREYVVGIVKPMVEEEIKEKVREEVKEKIEEKKIKVTIQLLKISDLSPKQIADIQELPIEVVLELQKEIENES